MGTLLPYIFPILLGRTFDLDKMRVGVDIFPQHEIEKTVILHNPITETQFKVIDSGMEARDLLDVGGSFSLSVKANLFHGGASGDYLSDTYNRENVVDVTVKATYQLATEQLQPDVRPVANWRSMGGALGTHFVRSLTYGGELIASLRMICNNTSDRNRIKAAIDVGGRIKIFDIGVEVESEYLKSVSRAVDSTEIKVFSSIPLSKIPNDMETLKEMIDSFPEDLARFNGGKGVPIKMELWPLEYFDSSRTTKVRNRLLEAHLNTFEQKFDDLLNTKTAISDWMKTATYLMSPEHEEKVGKTFTRVNKVLRYFYKVIGDLDTSLGIEQLEIALDAYGKSSTPGTYFKKFLALRQTLTSHSEDWVEDRGRGANYVHWGRNTCNDLSDTISSGTAFKTTGTTNKDLICVPTSGESTDKKQVLKAFQSWMMEESNITMSLPCCTCRVRSKSSVLTFPGHNECPPGWDSLYRGVLANGRFQDGLTFSAAFVCLDERNWNETSPVFVPNKVQNVQEVGSNDEEESLLSCVVCTK